MVDYNFEDYSWMEDRIAELDEKFTTFDPNTEIALDPQWYGIYRVRVLPVINKADFLVPFGVHWNVIPGTEDKPYTQFGCPQFSHNRYCPVCDAINTAIAERRAKLDNFKGADGKNSITVQRRFLMRVLLLDFEPGDGNGKKKVPVFTNLPQLKIMKIPSLVANDIRSKADPQNKDFGPKKILSPKEGRILRIEKSTKLQNYWKLDVMDPMEVPEEFMNPEAYPDIQLYLPDTTAAQISELIEKNQRNVHPIIANHVLSIDAGQAQAQLPPANKPSKEELRNRLKSL